LAFLVGNVLALVYCFARSEVFYTKSLSSFPAKISSIRVFVAPESVDIWVVDLWTCNFGFWGFPPGKGLANPVKFGHIPVRFGAPVLLVIDLGMHEIYPGRAH
jgi:hypothetical protein